MMLRYIILLIMFQVSIFNGLCQNGIVGNGSLEVKFYDKNGKIISLISSVNEFRFSVESNGRWIVAVKPLPKTNDVMYGKEDTILMSFDGADTYYCRYSEAFLEIKNGRPQMTKTLPVTNIFNRAYISTGNYPFAPFDEQRRANALWLVFGSGKYINDSSSKTMPLPWFAARWNLLAYGFRTDSELSATPPYLPKKIKYLRDQNLDYDTLSGEKNRPELDQNSSAYSDDDLKEQFQNRKAQWQQGDVAGLLETANITNYDGISLPLSFTIKSFYPGGKINRLYVGAITKISGMVSSETFRPPIIANLSVHDSRFRTRDNTHRLDKIIYVWKKSDGEDWPATNSAYLGRMKGLYLNSELASKNRPALMSKLIVRDIVLGLFLFSSVLILIFGFKNMKKRQTRQKANKKTENKKL